MPIKKLSYKKIIIATIILSIAGYGFYRYKKSKSAAGETRYITAQAEKGALIVSVSRSGQISASDQIDIKPETSGNVISINVSEGQKIKNGEIIATIDSHNAQKTVRDASLAFDIANTELKKLIDPADELEIVKAENSIKTAKDNLEKLLSPTDDFTLQQAQNNLDDAKNSLEKLKYSQGEDYQNALNAKQKAEISLNKTYEDTYNSISNIFLDLPEIITNTRDILQSYAIAQSDSSSVPCYCENTTVLLNSVFGDDRFDLENFIDKAIEDYEDSKEKFDENFANYKDTSRYSEAADIEALLSETAETIKSVSQTVKSEMNMLDLWIDCRNKDNQKIFSKVSDFQSTLKSYTSKTGSYLSSVASLKNSIEDSKDNKSDAEKNIIEMEKSQPLDLSKSEWNITEKEESLRKLNEGAEESEIEAAEISIQEKEAALEDLKAGADNLDVRTKRNSVQQKADALADAKQTLNDCSVKAPFDGIIGKLSVKKDDSVSSSALIATLITEKQIAEISLNEVDIAKIKIGNKATLTFDAVSDLSITGQVASIDSIGSTTQGVVTYTVKITLDMQDERIKSGMSVSASIIINSKQDVLSISNSAVKQSGETSYVEIMENNTPRRQTVEVGLSNDTSTEIVSGINEGDSVITQTIAASSNTSPTSSTKQSAGLNIPGLSGSNNAGTIRNNNFGR